MTEYSLADIESMRLPKGSPADRAIRIFNLAFTEDYYNEFINLIHECLESIFGNLVEGRKHHQNDLEDRLSLEVVGQLRIIGFNVTHDAESGGHCDIYISLRNAVWIAEAKRIKSNEQAYIEQGRLQLTERYISGLKFQNRGAIVIYCFAPNAQKVLQDLADRLSNDQYVVEAKKNVDDLYFDAYKEHTSTGNKCYVKSYIVPLHHNPPV